MAKLDRADSGAAHTPWNYITKYSLDVIELTIDLLAALHPHPSTSL
jgi:hypothetical protein